jgi:hypothetical protein
LEAKPNTTLAALESAYLDVLSSVDEFDGHKAQVVKSGTLTPVGITADTLNFAASKSAPRLQKARRQVEQARLELAAKRAKLVPKQADPADAAGQTRRLWKLDKFNSMSDSERARFIAQAGDKLDPELAQAFLEAPEYAKLLPSDLSAIREQALRREYGDEVFSEIENLEAGIKIASDTLAAARAEIADDVGGLEALNRAAEPFEKLSNAPWLKKFPGEDGAEVIRTPHAKPGGRTFTWREATSEEIAAGIYFGSYDEYRAAQAGALPPSAKPNGGGA